jgi:hypothetical protein
VHHYGFSRQDPEQVLERPALDRLIGCQHHHERAGDEAYKIPERGIDAQLVQLLATKRITNEFVHGLVLCVSTDQGSALSVPVPPDY